MVTYKITSKVNLNNRNAFELIGCLNGFCGGVYIEKESEQRRANAKSLLGLLSLGIINGDKVNVIIDSKNDDVEGIFDGIKSVLCKCGSWI